MKNFEALPYKDYGWMPETMFYTEYGKPIGITCNPYTKQNKAKIPIKNSKNGQILCEKVLEYSLTKYEIGQLCGGN